MEEVNKRQHAFLIILVFWVITVVLTLYRNTLSVEQVQEHHTEQSELVREV